MQSSRTMPHPPGNCSNCRVGHGFQISNKRNKPKPSATAFQFRCVAPESAIHCPATSSITTICGSSRPNCSAVAPADQTATGKSARAAAAQIKGGMPKKGSTSTAAASEPTVPGAFGTNPQPNQVLRTRATNYSASSSISIMPACKGSEMTYFSEAQLPKSTVRQRSLQKGKSGSPKATDFLQMGHCVRIGWLISAESGGAIALPSGYEGALPVRPPPAAFLPDRNHGIQ